MIEKIGLLNNSLKFKKNSVNKKQNNELNNNVVDKKSFATPTSQQLQSYYVSFGSKKNKKGVQKEVIKETYSGSQSKLSELENNASYHGQKLLSDSKKLAEKYNHSQVSQIHVLRVGLENIKKYIDGLNSGEISYEDETSFSTPSILEAELGKNVFKDREKREKIKPVIEKEIEILDKKLKEMPVSQTNTKNKKDEFTNDFLNDIYSLYQQENEEDACGDGLCHDSVIFEAAFYPNNDQLKKEITVPFRNQLKDLIQIDKRPLSDRIYLSFYDDKANNVWKNLAVGTNMAVLHDKETTPSYLVNSILQVFENSSKGFGNLTKENTEILNLNDNGELDSRYISRKLSEFSKNPQKNYVVIMSIMDDDMNSLAIVESNVEIFKNAPANVKFVMVADKDKYYKESTGSYVSSFFSEVGEVTVPLMNMNQAKKMFKEQPKLTEKLKKKFSQQALDKCIEAANQLKGNYPEKVHKVLDLVSAYYVDKDKISVAEVENYIKEAVDIFKPTENDNAIKIVFDTNIKLKDMVGTPTTKKEAKSISDRIKDKSIGTKGFLIYSQDGSVGAGRKYTAQAIAGETKSPYIEINAVDFGTKDVDLFWGENLSPEASMRKLFSLVKAQADANPLKSAVLFIENFEYFSYGEFVSEYHEKAFSQLLREMNKAKDEGLNIVIVGSMNDPRYIGSAMEKSFQFIDEIEVESPGFNNEAREEIINFYIKKKNIKLSGDATEQEKCKEHIKLLTERCSYIEIMTLLDKAKNVARERKHKAIDKGDFTEAFLQITTGRPASAQKPDYDKRIITSHECGHALNATIMEELAEKTNEPSHKGTVVNFITLDPRGTFGGAVFTADSINPVWSFEHVFSDIVCDFGGNSCEKHFFGQDGSWGITCDMAMATNSASMATSIMGQGKHFGKKSVDGMWVMSEQDKDNINKDVEVILKNAQIVSDAITEVYADFNKEFTAKYSSKVGTGECIIQREEFLKMLNEWRAKQSPEKQKEMALLDDTILQVIAATKRGVACYREQ